MSCNYFGLFEDWEIAIAKKLVSDFIKTRRCFQEYDFDDLMQECLTHWLSVRDGYDEGRRASKRTFMGHVIRNKLKDLVAQRQAEKREPTYFAISLDAPLVEGESRTLLDEIEETTADERTRDLCLEVGLSVDLAKALEKLTPRQQDICRLAMEGYDVTEMSKELGLSRSTIYEEKKRIRDFFHKQGLEDYWR